MKDNKMISMVSPDLFYEEIESLVCKFNLDYIDAVVYFCEQNNLEIETAAAILKGNAKMKAILQNQAEDLNLLPKTAKLPL